MKPSFTIVGCGKVGNVLGRFLMESGYRPVGVAGKSSASAKMAAEKLGGVKYSDHAFEVTREADIVFITTPDRVIQSVFAEIETNRGFKSQAIVLHCSGVLPSSELSPGENTHVSIGSLHPLQSIASKDIDINPFKGIIMSVEGEPEAVAVARQIAVDLGATCLTIRTEAKILYHAAAVAASNYLVTLMDHSFRLLEIAGISAEDAFSVLGPLVQGTLKNIQQNGITKALTGPIARGDVETIQKHIGAIMDKAPDQLMLYKALGLNTIKIAKAGQTLTDDAEKNLSAELAL